MKKRMNRATYAVLLATLAAAYMIMVSTMKRPPGAELLVAFIAVPRLHDTGRSGWWLLILLAGEIAALLIGWQSGSEGVLLAGGLFVFAALGALILLAFVPGQPHANEWGDPPPTGVHFGKTSVAVATSSTTEPSRLPIFAFVLAATLTVGAAIYLLVPRSDSQAVAVVPDGKLPSSDVAVLVQGWKVSELRRITTLTIPKGSISLIANFQS